MSKLTKANEARKEKSLNKLWKFQDQGIKSFKQLIDLGIYDRAEEVTVSKYIYNRTKFNRMNQAEQDVYEEKLKEKKTAYRLWRKAEPDTCSEVSRFVFEYFNETEQHNCNNCEWRGTISEMIKTGHTTHGCPECDPSVKITK